MGNLVNNKKFDAGYVDMQNGKHNDKTFLWEALSAMSEKLGKDLFLNVRDYIDNVTDIDVCKVNALRSMMHMVGLDY
jgi:hypothetical protein